VTGLHGVAAVVMDVVVEDPHPSSAASGLDAVHVEVAVAPVVVDVVAVDDDVGATGAHGGAEGGGALRTVDLAVAHGDVVWLADRDVEARVVVELQVLDDQIVAAQLDP
jgi:hypothetical protein